jgi:hypothetical protein
MVSSNNKTDGHDITETLLNPVESGIKHTNPNQTINYVNITCQQVFTFIKSEVDLPWYNFFYLFPVYHIHSFKAIKVWK